MSELEPKNIYPTHEDCKKYSTETVFVSADASNLAYRTEKIRCLYVITVSSDVNNIARVYSNNVSHIID